MVYADTFDRGDTSTVPNTTELVGNWANTSNALHPDHAASDQRLRFDNAVTTTFGALQRITIRGQTGDRIGLGFVTDADGDSFAEATVRFGTSNGRINLNRYSDAVLNWTWNEELECAENDYNIPDETPLAVEFCYSLRSGMFSTNVTCWHFKVDVGGGTMHRVGYAELGYFVNAHGAALTGTDAVTAYFDDYSFELVNDSGTCEFCPHCEFGVISVAGDAVVGGTEQVAGTWTDAGTDLVETADADAILLWDEEVRWANDNMGCDLYIPGLGPTAPYKMRIIFSWVDSNNYWYAEFYVASTTGFWDVDWSIVHRAGGVDTTVDSGTFSVFGFSTSVRLLVWGCSIALWSRDVFIELQSCLTDAALNNTGRWGIGTGDTVTDVARFPTPRFFCANEFDCETIGDYEPPEPLPEPPDYPPPGDPFASCCPDLADVELGDPFLVQLLALDVDTGPGCPDTEICNDSEIAVFLAMSDFHTIYVVYYDENTIILVGDTGVVVPCSGSDETVKIKVQITRTGENECTITGTVFIATCHIFYQATITDDTDCLSTEVTLVGRPGVATCCLHAAGPMVLSLP
ncbi:MAG: hypothetical protein AB7G51_08420 [Steroidobacteraceae bacterium]